MRRMIVLFTLFLCLGACSAVHQHEVTSISTVDNTWGPTRDVEKALMSRILGEITLREGNGEGQYSPENYDLLSRHTLPVQHAFPKGATILRVIASESGVPEVQRLDLAATIFLVPGKSPAFTCDGLPSKCSCDNSYSIYDIGRPNEVLLIIERPMSACGGAIEIAFWNTEANLVDEVWGCAGEESGVEFSHSLRIRDGELRLTVFGIFSQKRKGYEKERAELAADLGFPVEFVYDPRH